MGGATRVGGVRTWLVFAGYVLLALLLFGLHVVGHAASRCACDLNPYRDATSYMWSLAWWPHAVAHGMNPFYTRALWAPGGLDVAASGASVPLAAAVLSPVTEAFGTVPAYNVMTVLGPALSAFTAYLLSRRVCARSLPAVAGGLAFGFSSYETVQLIDHPNLYLTCLLPLLVLLAVLRLDGELPRGRFVGGMALLFAGQVLLSTELLFDSILLAIPALVIGYLIAPRDLADRLRGVTAEIVLAGAIAALVTAPYLYWGLFKQPPTILPDAAESFKLDLANLVLPGRTTWLGGSALASVSARYSATLSEAVGYIGLPLLALFVYYLVSQWRTRLARYLGVMFALSVLLALGPHLAIAGSGPSVPLPWRLIERLPVFRADLPSRFSVFSDLFLALGVSGVLAVAPDRRRIPAVALAVCGLAFILPNPVGPWWNSPMPPTQLISSRQLASSLPHDPIVLTLPFGPFGDEMYWQAASGFRFRLADGYMASTPPPGDRDSSTTRLYDVAQPPRTPSALSAFLRGHPVAAVVLTPAAIPAWGPTLTRLRLHPELVNGVYVYRPS